MPQNQIYGYLLNVPGFLFNWFAKKKSRFYWIYCHLCVHGLIDEKEFCWLLYFINLNWKELNSYMVSKHWRQKQRKDNRLDGSNSLNYEIKGNTSVISFYTYWLDLCIIDRRAARTGIMGFCPLPLTFTIEKIMCLIQRGTILVL